MAISASTATASADGALPGEVMWPPQADAGPAELAEIGREALNVSDPVVVGHPAKGQIDVERINGTASRITVNDAEGGEQSYVQRHRTPEDRSYPTLSVSAQQLEPSVHVTPKQPHSLMQIYGPPGTFNASGSTPSELITSFREGADLPPLHGSSASERTFSMQALRPACAERVDGDCEELVSFRLECGNCDQRVREVRPTPSQELDDTTNLSVGGHDNVVRFNIRQGSPGNPPELVAVQLPLAFDLDVSQALSPDEAGHAMVDAVNERGYRIAHPHDGEVRSGFSGLPFLKAKVLPSDRQVQPKAGEYFSPFLVVEGSEVPDGSSPKEAGDTWAEIRVDMESGEVRDLELGSRAVAEEGSSGENESSNASDAAPVDAAGALAAGVALAASALAVRRRRPT